jgi:15-cis-phytoene synthase
MASDGLEETLPVLQRLALSYAPPVSRAEFLALFALESRLAGIVRAAHEPMLAQIRLAWWREQLVGDTGSRTGSDPVVAALAGWTGAIEPLVHLVNAWEGLLDASSPALIYYSQLADARGHCFAAMHGAADHRSVVQRLGCNWALYDIAEHLSDPTEREALRDHAQLQDWSVSPLPRAMRPLAVLFGLAARAFRSKTGAVSPGRAMLIAMRIGWLGR